ncbi:HindVP family restriction endonuclease [Sporofaciens musculi]|uniref:HindVP family restriction endonuclease n=1 Tax=Sporofaciens musculi TaxID=2681861 RepID=UPI0025A09508|nr:HindVP family restriction endonuclease [Sporofaciens musculi]
MPNGLYGVYHSNRSADDHWGKNRFNSSFPAALAAYMLDHDLPVIYIKLESVEGKLEVVPCEISMREVFNSGNRSLQQLYYAFESVFKPYQNYSFDAIDGIDLVIKDINGQFLSPLEVKLTVIPTSQTCNRPETEWGSEVVVRTATTSYCAFGMFDAVKDKAKEVRNIFEEACSSIQSWDNDFEMTHKMDSLCHAVDSFEFQYHHRQKPLLLQTLWKTQGQSPLLADQAFDIVVWSDYAFSRLFLDGSDSFSSTMKREMRASARLARCIWELSKSGKIHMKDIYRQMAFGNQTDKEFAVGGPKWRRYVNAERVQNFALNKSVVHEIIEDGYIDRLMPERRFDQTLYFTMRR